MPRKQQDQQHPVHDHAIHERSVRRQLAARDVWMDERDEKESE